MLLRVCGLLILTVTLAPGSSRARDVAACGALIRQLNNAPQIIGDSAEARRYARELSNLTSEIRALRIEMRRNGCGAGSVIVYGRANHEICDGFRASVQELEKNREAVTAERDAARQLVRSSDERTRILAAIRANDCLPSDFEDDQNQRLKVQGIELPKAPAYSGITKLGTDGGQKPETVAAEPPPPPERPYDPDRKVRMVGPRFLPERRLDLAHPSVPGPQPQQ